MAQDEQDYDILKDYDVKDILSYCSHPFDGDFLRYKKSDGSEVNLQGRSASTIYREFKKAKLIKEYGTWENIPIEKKTIFLFI